MPRLFIQRRMDRDEIGFGQQRVEWRIGESSGMFLLRRFAPRRIVENAHAKTVRAAGHRLSDQAAATDKSERLVPHERAEQMTRLGAGKLPCPHHAVPFNHAPGHGKRQCKRQVCCRLGGACRHHRHRNAAGGRCLHIDIRGRDRLRRNQAQRRVGGNDAGVNLIVQETKQDIITTKRGDQRTAPDNAAGVGVDRNRCNVAEPRDRAFGHWLGDVNARLAANLHASHRTTPATPSTATCAPSGMRLVASSTPSTIGMPRSRPSAARCDVEPPSSATTPPTLGRI